MALSNGWNDIEERLEQLSRHGALRPTVRAIRRATFVVSESPDLADVQPSLSLASLTLGLPGVSGAVVLSWIAGEGYYVAMWEPPAEPRDRVQVAERDLLRILRRYLSHLRDAASEGD